MKYKDLNISKDEILHRMYVYPECGLAFWKKNPKGSTSDLAGYLRKDGYLALKFNKEPIWMHRLIWLVEYGKWPKGYIDHINGIRSDNRISNLRCVNKSENNINRYNRRNGFNLSKHPYISFNKNKCFKNKPWVVRYKDVHIGNYESEEIAKNSLDEYLKSKNISYINVLHT